MGGRLRGSDPRPLAPGWDGLRGGRNMAEAKEEGPGPRARVSGGRGGGQRGGVRGRGQAGRGPGRLRGCSVRGAAAPAAVQGPDERPRRARGPAASPGCPAEPACSVPSIPGLGGPWPAHRCCPLAAGRRAVLSPLASEPRCISRFLWFSLSSH